MHLHAGSTGATRSRIDQIHVSVAQITQLLAAIAAAAPVQISNCDSFNRNDSCCVEDTRYFIELFFTLHDYCNIEHSQK
jgi:hypothetical protein